MNRVSAEQLEDFRSAFDMMDRDHSGAISADELGTVMRSLGLSPSHDDIKEMILQHDLDRSGQIEFNEFCDMMLKHMHCDDREEQLKIAFRHFDKDGSGKISADELRTVMSSLGEKLTPDEINEMIEAADTDGDGQINYEEFVTMMVGNS